MARRVNHHHYHHRGGGDGWVKLILILAAIGLVAKALAIVAKIALAILGLWITIKVLSFFFGSSAPEPTEEPPSLPRLIRRPPSK